MVPDVEMGKAVSYNESNNEGVEKQTDIRTRKGEEWSKRMKGFPRGRRLWAKIKRS
jgi:hypothetical protein